MATAVWGDESEADRVAAGQVHGEVCIIAGQIGKWLAGGEAREALAKTHPTDLAIYDGFLAAAAKGTDVYKAWCGKEAVALREAHRQAMYEKAFGKK